MLGRLSLRARLVLAVLALAAVGLVAADVATYASLRSFLVDRTDNSLEDSAHSLRGPGGGRAGSARRRGARCARPTGRPSLATLPTIASSRAEGAPSPKLPDTIRPARRARRS